MVECFWKIHILTCLFWEIGCCLLPPYNAYVGFVVRFVFFFGHDFDAWVDRGAGEAKIKRNKKLRLSKWSVFWVVVSNILYFHPYLGKIPILTNIFQMGWNHQLFFLYQTWWVFKITVQRSSSWAMGWRDLNDVLSYTRWSLKETQNCGLKFTRKLMLLKRYPIFAFGTSHISTFCIFAVLLGTSPNLPLKKPNRFLKSFHVRKKEIPDSLNGRGYSK